MNIQEEYAIVYIQLCAGLNTPCGGMGYMDAQAKRGPLRVRCEDWLDESFGSKLFGEAYPEASAYTVQIGRAEAEICVFDANNAAQTLDRDWPKDARTALYSNRRGDAIAPTEQDLKNLAAMPEGTTLYIVCGRRCVRWNGKRG